MDSEPLARGLASFLSRHPLRAVSAAR
jgi:hypothetical protein